jgi:hypothetical protein
MWVGKGYNPINYDWIFDWYANGIPVELLQELHRSSVGGTTIQSAYCDECRGNNGWILVESGGSSASERCGHGSAADNSIFSAEQDRSRVAPVDGLRTAKKV